MPELKEILPPALSRMTNLEFYSFTSMFNQLLRRSDALPAHVTQKFYDAYSKYDFTMRAKESLLAIHQRENANKAMESAYANLKTHVTLYKQHPQEEIRQASATVATCFPQKESSLSQSFDARIARISRVYNTIKALDDETLERSLVKPWLEVLATTHKEMQVCQENCLFVSELVPPGQPRQVRLELAQQTQSLITSFGPLLYMYPSEGLENLYRVIEQFCKTTRSKQKARKTRRENAKIRQAQKAEAEKLKLETGETQKQTATPVAAAQPTKVTATTSAAKTSQTSATKRTATKKKTQSSRKTTSRRR